jgi:hypothetical protein
MKRIYKTVANNRNDVAEAVTRRAVMPATRRVDVVPVARCAVTSATSRVDSVPANANRVRK